MNGALSIETQSVQNELASCEPGTIRCPIFILGCHKSGTSLLRALLDGHPELFVIPKETHFFQYAKYWVSYPLRQHRGCMPERASLWDRMKDKFEAEQCRRAGPHGDSPGFGGYDISKVKSFLTSVEAGSPREEFCTYMAALYYATHDSVLPGDGSVRVVEKSVENAEYAPILRQWFPGSLFIHIVRNPYATISSIRRSKSSRGYPRMKPIAESMKQSYDCLLRNSMTMDGYLPVQYEDLVENTEASMMEIAKYLGIRWDSVLMSPTMLGSRWKSNSTYDLSSDGVDVKGIARWRETITNYEIAVVNKAASGIFGRFSYERIGTGSKAFLRCGGEGLKRYLENRLDLVL